MESSLGNSVADSGFRDELKIYRGVQRFGGVYIKLICLLLGIYNIPATFRNFIIIIR